MTIENPWKRTGSRVVYTNPWISVREDQVIRPDGKRGIYGVVETRVATGAVPLTEDGRIYLVGQYRYPLDCYSWEVPQGGADPGEQPLAAVQRELLEETGLEAAQWVPLGGEIHLSNCISSERGFLWIARGLERTAEPEPEGTEVLAVKCIPLEEAYAMLLSGEITDAMSIIALHRTAHFLAEEKRHAAE